MATSPVTLPPGYALESSSTTGGLPPGYTLEQPQQPSDDSFFHGFGNASQADIDRMKAQNSPMHQLGQGALGIIKSAGQTVKTLVDLPEIIARSKKPDELDKTLEPANEDQQTGANMETILEFALGDSALKGLSLADKLAESSKLAKFIQRYPRLSNILGDAIRGGTAGGAVGAVHDGTEGAIEGAAGGAAFGGGLSAVSELAPVVKKAAGAAKDLLLPTEDVKAQVVKDAIKHSLGNKADAGIVQEAYSRMDPQKLSSTTENELKLVKPRLAADIQEMDGELNQILYDAHVKATTLPEPAVEKTPEYARRQQLQLKMGVPVNKMDPVDAKNWLGYNGEKEMTVYRGGAPRDIEPGDFVTTSPEAAKVYADETRDEVRGFKVPSSHLRYVRGHINGDPSLLDMGGQTELVYAPKKGATAIPLTTEPANPLTVTNAKTKLDQAFDGMIADSQKGVGDTKEATDAINAVRNRVVSKVQDDPTSPLIINQLKRTVGDQINKFQPPDMVNTAGKAEQEAYRQAYFALRDMVSDAVPETKELNARLSRAFELKDMLDKKFPQLETEAQAKASYKGVRSQNLKKTGKEVLKHATGIGVGGGTVLGAAKLFGK